MKFPNNIYIEAKKYSLDNSKIACCGLIYKTPNTICFKECENTHPDPENFFEINSSDYLKTISLGNVLAVFHSHPKTKGPSEKDKQMSKNLDIPFLIYSLIENKFYCT